MGDVIMTTPALRALKESLGAHLTLLTSPMGRPIVPFIPVIDDVVTAAVPWVGGGRMADAAGLQALIRELGAGCFDAAVVFTVYSQSALPAALLALLAGIPLRVGYSRENPYGLLTDWVPDEEPYGCIRHQVERDLHLAAHMGAVASDTRLLVKADPMAAAAMRYKLLQAGLPLPGRFVVFHPGVSEAKRQYPLTAWQELARLMAEWGIPVVVTGTAAERPLAAAVCGPAPGIFNAAGLLAVGEFIALLDAATLVVSVNTATVHIAAALQKPQLVLYALTNPQHTPWQSPARVFPFPVDDALRSRNQVVRYVQDTVLDKLVLMPDATLIAQAIRKVWLNGWEEVPRKVPAGGM